MEVKQELLFPVGWAASVIYFVVYLPRTKGGGNERDCSWQSVFTGERHPPARLTFSVLMTTLELFMCQTNETFQRPRWAPQISVAFQVQNSFDRHDAFSRLSQFMRKEHVPKLDSEKMSMLSHRWRVPTRVSDRLVFLYALHGNFLVVSHAAQHSCN